LEKIKSVYSYMEPGKNILQTSLQNANPMIHPSITLLNAALIERTHGDFFFYHEGVTPVVGRLLKAIDNERIAIGKNLNIDILPDPEIGGIQGYMKDSTYDTGYSEAPGFEGIKAQNSLDHRYFHEDVGYGLVFMKTLAEQAGVETPYISAVIKLVSLLMNRDYLTEAKRTMESLGLSGYSPEELNNILS
ncbi:NAD/NADP octopine/nopaline dehydrogenase family protein, partial [bacterium]|nr:NAD/NADP octopine/nopaline dehydrogenase family protein [bacterium]